MQFDCDKIKQLLESNSENEQTLEILENHFRQCSTCGSLVKLDKPIESELKLALPNSSPDTISKYVMEKINLNKIGIFPWIKFDTVYPYLLAILVFIPVTAVIWGWSSIKSFLAYFNIDGVITKASNMISGLPDLNSLLPEYAIQFMTSSHMITILVICSAFIWVFSILEMEKAVK
jgi:hypothetical protein